MRVLYLYGISNTYVTMSFWISDKLLLSMVEWALLTLSNIIRLIRKISSYRRLSLRGGTLINKIIEADGLMPFWALSSSFLENLYEDVKMFTSAPL